LRPWPPNLSKGPAGVLQFSGRLARVPPALSTQTHRMNVFVRYFVELPLPASAVDDALNRIPAAWLVGMAREAQVLVESLLLEAGVDLGAQRAGSAVDLAMAAPIHLGSSTVRQMTWSAVGGARSLPIFRGEIEIARVGHNGAQLSVSGRYWPPSGSVRLASDRAIVLRAGEATLHEFLDRLASAVTMADQLVHYRAV